MLVLTVRDLVSGGVGVWILKRCLKAPGLPPLGVTLGVSTEELRQCTPKEENIITTLSLYYSELQRPSGPPDHHRGLHYHRIRGSGPLLLLLFLISYPKLVSQHHRRIPAPISGNLYSKWYFPVMGGSSPLSLPPSTSQAPSLEEHVAKGQEEKGR